VCGVSAHEVEQAITVKLGGDALGEPLDPFVLGNCAHVVQAGSKAGGERRAWGRSVGCWRAGPLVIGALGLEIRGIEVAMQKAASCLTASSSGRSYHSISVWQNGLQ
jgi:hypothetical protein